ncbi:MAG TPA: HDOD domain-containing protein [Burkholderiaceae bacterium]|jgi:EAL and modified HD-GYP domain-containing signal transduction protein|nr:HDOD domain-containing protein [Burkholderiaceae bacterium]
MNAPERIANAAIGVLDTLPICYAPLIDKKRKAIGTRLTMVATNPNDRLPIGHVLEALNTVWPESSAPVLVAPLDATFDESALDWDAPSNAILEISTAAMRDPLTQTVAQSLFRDGKRLALRGRPDVALPPALLSCFEYTLVHISDDRRRGPDAGPPAGVTRRIPFIITGVQTVADVDAAYERGAAASVGWPLEDVAQKSARPLQPGQAVVLELLRLVRDDADIAKIDATLKRDPALAFKLLRLVNSAAFGLPVQITSFQHAVMMLGYKKLTRWLSLLLATASKDTNTFPLMHASIRRGMFLENIGAEERQTELRDELFITGAFSLLDRITGAPFAHLFELISLSESIVDAIVRRTGPYAPYLTLIEAIERSDPIGIRKQADQLALSIGACNQALLRSMNTAELLDVEI